MLWFGLRDLLRHWKLVLAMSLVASVAICIYLTLVGYQAGLAAQFGPLDTAFLTIQERNSFGEIYGSRLSPLVGAQLIGMGVKWIVPEIHDVVGTSIEDAVLLRGVDLEQYEQVNTYHLVVGTVLHPGDAPRQAMAGYRLAEKLGLAPGGTISLRGRDFTIRGVFRTGTYADNEAWISLKDAQDLLGWGSDVSVYIIQTGGPIKAGDSLPGGAVASKRGEGGQTLSNQYKPVLEVHGVAAQAMGVVTALTLANVLLRLALIRRRDLAILRTVGFQRYSLIIYLAVQAVGIAILGAVLAGLGTLGTVSIMRLGVFGFDIRPLFDAKTLFFSGIWLMVITAAGTILPVWVISRLNLAGLLRAE
jgi:ABC-type lipoprotein release transport system permease subunit